MDLLPFPEILLSNALTISSWAGGTLDLRITQTDITLAPQLATFVSSATINLLTGGTTIPMSTFWDPANGNPATSLLSTTAVLSDHWYFWSGLPESKCGSWRVLGDGTIPHRSIGARQRTGNYKACGAWSRRGRGPSGPHHRLLRSARFGATPSAAADRNRVETQLLEVTSVLAPLLASTLFYLANSVAAPANRRTAGGVAALLWRGMSSLPAGASLAALTWPR